MCNWYNTLRDRFFTAKTKTDFLRDDYLTQNLQKDQTTMLRINGFARSFFLCINLLPGVNSIDKIHFQFAFVLCVYLSPVFTGVFILYQIIGSL